MRYYLVKAFFIAEGKFILCQLIGLGVTIASIYGLVGLGLWPTNAVVGGFCTAAHAWSISKIATKIAKR
ncbi:hypothetical protein VPHD479_0105 [Vibrio phage D479]